MKKLTRFFIWPIWFNIETCYSAYSTLGGFRGHIATSMAPIYAAGGTFLHLIITHIMFTTTLLGLQYIETIDVLLRQRPPVPYVPGYLTVTKPVSTVLRLVHLGHPEKHVRVFLVFCHLI